MQVPSSSIVILYMYTRWDCTSEEEEYFIHAAHSQHVDRTCELLVSRLGAAETAEEARRRMFFVSAKEVLEERRRSQENLLDSSNDPVCSVQMRLREERKAEWDRYETTTTDCIVCVKAQLPPFLLFKICVQYLVLRKRLLPSLDPFRPPPGDGVGHCPTGCGRCERAGPRMPMGPASGGQFS